MLSGLYEFYNSLGPQPTEADVSDTGDPGKGARDTDSRGFYELGDEGNARCAGCGCLRPQHQLAELGAVLYNESFFSKIVMEVSEVESTRPP